MHCRILILPRILGAHAPKFFVAYVLRILSILELPTLALRELLGFVSFGLSKLVQFIEFLFLPFKLLIDSTNIVTKFRSFVFNRISHTLTSTPARWNVRITGEEGRN